MTIALQWGMIGNPVHVLFQNSYSVTHFAKSFSTVANRRIEAIHL